MAQCASLIAPYGYWPVSMPVNKPQNDERPS
jgi:hypothetical protein